MDEDEALFFSRPSNNTNKRKRSGVESDSETSDGESHSSSVASSVVQPETETFSGQAAHSLHRDLDRPTFTHPPSRTRIVGDSTPPPRLRRHSTSLTPPPRVSPGRLQYSHTQLESIFAYRQPSPEATSRPDIRHVDTSDSILEQELRQRFETHTEESDDSAVLDVMIVGVHVAFENAASEIPDITAWESPTRFKVRLNTRLSLVKIMFCKLRGIQAFNGETAGQWQQRMDNIVLVYRNVRVFDHVTPSSLGIGPEEMPIFEAFTRQGFQWILDHPGERTTAKSVLDDKKVSVDTVETGDINGNQEPPGTTEQTKGIANYIKLKLRSQSGLVLNVRAKHTTKVSKVLDGFRQRHQLDCPLALVFEGETLGGDILIGDTDLEDENQVDVKFL